MRPMLNIAETLLVGVEEGLRSVFGTANHSTRPHPASGLDQASLDDAQRKLSAGLMRVNHAGEVAAQGLYQGQALGARTPAVRAGLEQASLEEREHLDWCRGRLEQLDSHTSLLDPLWYAGSYAIGAAAGLAGDKWSLGFVAETERQVAEHLDGHLQKLPPDDAVSRAILEQMKSDEQRHATSALESGGAELPKPVQRLMRATARVMTTLAFRI